MAVASDGVDALCALLLRSTRVVVVSGAGISTSCGIPDFRSQGGLYDLVQQCKCGDATDPQEVFDLEVFRDDPAVFYSIAHLLYKQVDVVPSPAHRFIAALEARGVLLRNYTQNVDGLEDAAGVTRVLRCHGSLATASCMRCGFQLTAQEMRARVAGGGVVWCPRCDDPAVDGGGGGGDDDSDDSDAKARRKRKAKKQSGGRGGGRGGGGARASKRQRLCAAVMKPDVVFFRESLPLAFEEHVAADMASADLLLVMGSSLAVRPVSTMPSMLPEGVPTVLINRERVKCPRPFTLELLGSCDDTCARVEEGLRRLRSERGAAVPSSSCAIGGAASTGESHLDDGHVPVIDGASSSPATPSDAAGCGGVKTES